MLQYFCLGNSQFFIFRTKARCFAYKLRSLDKNRKSARQRAFVLEKAMNNLTVSEVFEYHFWRKVKKSDAHKCWLWMGAKNRHGYGQTRIIGKSVEAHRLAWILSNGEISKGLVVCHKCDNPLCCNPNHLFLGTQKDNAQDRENKKRGVRNTGFASHNSKLSKNQVEEIRKRYSGGLDADYQKTLSKEYRVSRSTIYRVVHEKCYKPK